MTNGVAKGASSLLPALVAALDALDASLDNNVPYERTEVYEAMARVKNALQPLLAASPLPAPQEPAAWTPLPENAAEREQWNRMVKTIGSGDVRLAIAESLRIWARMSPRGGSYAEQCAIMANEVAKLYAAPAPADDPTSHKP